MVASPFLKWVMQVQTGHRLLQKGLSTTDVLLICLASAVTGSLKQYRLLSCLCDKDMMPAM